MKKAIGRLANSFAAYVFLLMGFVALGLFVYALATESYLTAGIGAALVCLFALAVVGFRLAARNIAESNESGIHIDGANVWAKPLRRAQIDQYLLSYRGASDVAERPPADEPDRSPSEAYRYAA